MQIMHDKLSICEWYSHTHSKDLVWKQLLVIYTVETPGQNKK